MIMVPKIVQWTVGSEFYHHLLPLKMLYTILDTCRESMMAQGETGSVTDSSASEYYSTRDTGKRMLWPP